MDRNGEIVEKIRKIQEEMEKQKLDGASPKQLAKYLVEVDRLKALMLTVYKK